ncbi:peptidase inhibitor family I36 protein [Streptomyces sp. NPDC048473]|uniref:peptidase inhibitor family I36 protein n=1 Tax=unclassified Streptomyces TaxID=2593676 RepID=UPI00371DB7B0
MRNWKTRAATAITGFSLVTGGMLATAPAAEAVGGCASGYLCIYDGSSFTGEKIVSASTNSCFTMKNFVDFDWIASYVNNLPVTATVWTASNELPYGMSKARTLPAGGFSSKIGISGLGSDYYDQVCMGNAKPWG